MGSWERHIYNNSSCPWTFQAATDHGNVYFHDPNGDVENGPYTLPAGQSIGIKYTTSDGNASGTFNITDSGGVTGSYGYSNGGGGCPSFNYYGSFENDPADCDMTILRFSWSGLVWNGGLVMIPQGVGFIMINGTLRGLTNGDILPKIVTDSNFIAIPSTDGYNVGENISSAYLARRSTDNAVFLVVNDTEKSWITDMSVFNEYHFDIVQVRENIDGVLAQLADGPTIN
jgi:hypothetical protein